MSASTGSGSARSGLALVQGTVRTVSVEMGLVSGEDLAQVLSDDDRIRPNGPDRSLRR